MKKFKKLIKSKKGASLTEILIAVPLIGILTTAGVPAYTGILEKAQENVCLYNQRILNNALEYYKIENSGKVPEDILILENLFVKEIPTPPGGGEYIIKNGQVVVQK